MNKNLVNKAILLAWITIIYNIVEGSASLFWGISEGSIALAGFGADSIIEVTSSSLVLWRFEEEAINNKHLNLKRERQATYGIAILFILLSFIMFITSAYQLIQQNHPQSTIPGLIISFISLFTMFFLLYEKKEVGLKLKSSTVIKDASCTFACIKLSVVLFIGSLLFWVHPSLWWVDGIASIFLAYLIYKEGLFTLNQLNKLHKVV